MLYMLTLLPPFARVLLFLLLLLLLHASLSDSWSRPFLIDGMSRHVRLKSTTLRAFLFGPDGVALGPEIGSLPAYKPFVTAAQGRRLLQGGQHESLGGWLRKLADQRHGVVIARHALDDKIQNQRAQGAVCTTIILQVLQCVDNVCHWGNVDR